MLGACLNARELQDPVDWGVHHFEVPGMLRAAEGPEPPTPVLAHVFLRAAGAGTAAAVRGFAFFERVDAEETLHPEWGGHIIQPEAIKAAAMLNFTLRGAPLSGVAEAWPLPVSRHPDTFRALHFTGEVPVDKWPQVGALHVNDWGRHALLPESLLADGAAREPPPPPHRVVTVLYPLDYYSEERRVYLVANHVRWHRALGFDGTVLYAASASPYAAARGSAGLVRSGALALMRWQQRDSGYSWQQVNHYRKYDQNLVYTHALLAHWRRNTHLMFIDTDEFIAFDRPASIKELLGEGGCLAPHYDEAGIHWHDAAVFEDGKPLPELPLWDAAPLDLAGNMRRYRHVNPHGGMLKSLAFADSVSGYGIHIGIIIKPGHPLQGDVGKDVPSECARVLHFRNLVDKEEAIKLRDVNALQQSDAWHWLLQRLDAHGGGGGSGGGHVAGSRVRRRDGGG